MAGTWVLSACIRRGKGCVWGPGGGGEGGGVGDGHVGVTRLSRGIQLNYDVAYTILLSRVKSLTPNHPP